MTFELVDRERLLLASVTSASAAEVHARLLEQAAVSGRQGLVADLRRRAEAHAASPLAFDQVKTSACHAAADDIAWGRAPLANWRFLAGDETEPSAEARQGVRSTLPDRTQQGAAFASEAVAELESGILEQAPSTFAGIHELQTRFENAMILQHLLWDDPRLCVHPEMRVCMGQALDVLKRRLGQLQVVSGPRERVTPVDERRTTIRSLIARVWFDFSR